MSCASLLTPADSSGEIVLTMAGVASVLGMVRETTAGNCAGKVTGEGKVCSGGALLLSVAILGSAVGMYCR